MITTASSTSAYMSCPAKFEFKYISRFEPVKIVPVFMTGGLLHKGLEHLWKGESTAEQGVAMAEYRLQGERDFWGSSDGKLETIRCDAYISGYRHRWKVPDSNMYEVIDVEREFLYGDKGFPGVSFAGKWDAVLRRKSDNQLIIMDHKTAGSGSGADKPGSPYWQKLVMDNQVILYLKAAKEIYGEDAIFIYDVIMKTGSRPMKGRARQRKNETLMDFEQRRAEGDETLAQYAQRIKQDYDVQVERFSRREVAVTQEEMDRKMEELRTVFNDMLSPPYARNSTACVRGSIACPYLEVCIGQEALDGPSFRKKERAHSELELSESLNKTLEDF